MSKFEVGDKVVCRRPANTLMNIYVGKTGIIRDIEYFDGDTCLNIDGPFQNGGYSLMNSSIWFL